VELSGDIDPHNVLGLLKQFFIEPAESILTDELYEAFLHTSDIEDESARADCLIEVLKQLPPGNKIIISRLFRLLYTIQTHSEQNKMTSSNLSICFAPTLVRKQNMEILKILTNSETTKSLVQFMIEKYHAIFEPQPPQLHVPARGRSITQIPEPTTDDKQIREFKKVLLRGTVRLARNKMKELGQYEDIQDVSNEVSKKEEDIGIEDVHSVSQREMSLR